MGPGEILYNLHKYDQAILRLAADVAKMERDLDALLSGSAGRIELDELDALIANSREQRVKLEESRAGFIKNIPPDLLAVYDGLIAAKKVPPVAVMTGKVCPGCHLTVPDNRIVAARGGKSVVKCPNCARIIYPV